MTDANKTLFAAIARKGNTLALVNKSVHTHINAWGLWVYSGARPMPKPR